MRRLLPAATALVAAACATAVAARPQVDLEAAAVQAAYLHELDAVRTAVAKLKDAAAQLNDSPARIASAQQAFAEARDAYKRVELFVDYYAPTAAEQINGPALPEMEGDNPEKVIEAEGFQVLEEQLWSERPAQHREDAVMQASIVDAHLNRVRQYAQGMIFTDVAVFDAARLALARQATLGLANFDSPVAQRSGHEMRAALAGLRTTLAPYARRAASGSAATEWRTVQGLIDSLDQVLAAAPASGPDDRLSLLAGGFDPLMQRLVVLRDAIGIAPSSEVRLWRANAASLFAADAWNPAAFAPTAVPKIRDSRAAAALGARLFADPVLSRDRQRTCTSCHVPERAYTDGLRRSIARTDVTLRNTPTVLNVGLQAGSFADLRTTYLEDQVVDVVGSPAEMHGDLALASAALNADASYAAAFRAAYGEGRDGSGPASPARIRSALASHLRTLQALDSRFDRYMRGQRAALTPVEQQGFNVFVGKARCATCHFLPLFNGTVPPSFGKAEAEVLGVPAVATERNGRLDPDAGVGAVTRLAVQQHAFKTPTVRNAALTAPYFHNGAYRTLDEVVRFYDLGGGAGIGVRLPNQTLPADRLRLTTDERAALVAFMRALSDSTSQSAQPTSRMLARR